jgi:predicted tellurium resistance membrane protein TerC
MSLDNVLAIAAAAGGDTNLILFGLAISIPLVVFGSTVLMWLLDRVPILVWAGSALLGWVAAELIVTEPILVPVIAAVADQLGISVKAISRFVELFGAVLVIAIGWLVLKTSGRKRMAHGSANHVGETAKPGAE